MSAAPIARRALAFEALRETFERGAHTELAFRAGAERLGLAGRERAQAQRLAYGSVQRKGTSDAAIERLSGRSIRLLDPPVLAALRLGLYELLFADGTPDHAAVDQAVELVKAGRRRPRDRLRQRDPAPRRARARGADRGAARRRLDPRGRRGRPLGAALAGADVVGGARARDGALPLLAACNEPAEVAMRAPTPSRAATLAALREAGVDAAAGGGRLAAGRRRGDGLRRPGRRRGPALVAAGALTPQSRGSAAVVEVLDPRAGEHVLDLCAGPGIKTGQIAARMGDRGEVISVELDPARAAEIAAQAARLDLHGVTVFEGDATKLPLAPSFDRILLDAPCSDLGTLASRPDARWRKSPRTIERVAAVQEKALRGAARALRPGGTLVYSTCTISRRENEDRIAALLAAAAGGRAAAGAGRPRRARPGPRLAASSRAACSCAPTATHHRLLHRPTDTR